MNQSLQEWAGAGRESTTMLALLFTDIIDSTAIGNRMGDRRWIEVVMQHFVRARTLRDKFDCYEIKLIGDSYMVAFKTAAQALRFAVDFFLDTGHPDVAIRAGIHIGQVRIVDNDLYGRMVNYTSRVEHALQKPGIYLSSAAKEEVESEHGSESKEFSFRDYDVEVKGFKNAQIIYRVLSPAIRRVTVAWNKEQWNREQQKLNPVQQPVQTKLEPPPIGLMKDRLPTYYASDQSKQADSSKNQKYDIGPRPKTDEGKSD